MHSPSERHVYLFRPGLPLPSIPSGLGCRNSATGLSSFMGLKAQGLPSRSPSLFVSTQSLSLLLESSPKLVIRLFARVALRVLTILLLLLPELGLLPAFEFEAIENKLVHGHRGLSKRGQLKRLNGQKGKGISYGAISLGASGQAKGSFNSTVMRFCDLGRRHGP